MLSLGIYGLANVVFMAGLTIKSKDSIITVMDNYQAQLTELLSQVQATNDWQGKNDLNKLHKACSQILTEISKESVNCRRLQKATPKYLELDQQFKEAISNLEQWITFAKLLY